MFGKNVLNGVEEGLARMGEGGRDEEVASSEKTRIKDECKNRYPIYGQNGSKMAKIDTQFMTS